MCVCFFYLFFILNVFLSLSPSTASVWDDQPNRLTDMGWLNSRSRWHRLLKNPLHVIHLIKRKTEWKILRCGGARLLTEKMWVILVCFICFWEVIGSGSSENKTSEALQRANCTSGCQANPDRWLVFTFWVYKAMFLSSHFVHLKHFSWSVTYVYVKQNQLLL